MIEGSSPNLAYHSNKSKSLKSEGFGTGVLTENKTLTNNSNIDAQKNFTGSIEFTVSDISMQKNTITKSEAKSDTASPFFSVQRYPHIISETLAIFGKEKADKINLDRLARDLESIFWELTEAELPFSYNMFLLDNDRLVHESDLHTGKDLVDAVSEKMRRGIEKKQFIEAKKKAQKAKPGTTILIPSAKEYKRDEKPGECIYVDSILTTIYKADDETLYTRQFLIKKDTPNFEAPQMAQLINELVGKKIVDPNAHIDTLLMAIGEAEQTISNPQIWKAIEKVTGSRYLSKSVDQLEKGEQKYKKLSKEGANKMYEWIKAGVDGDELEKRYTSMVREMLHDVKSSKIIRSSTGDVSFITSCGEFGLSGMMTGVDGFFNEDGMYIEENTKWCTKCKIKNTCNKSICFKEGCNGRLSQIKPTLIVIAA